MGLVDRIERKLEATVGDAFARVFGGSIVPQEVETLLRREAQTGARPLGAHRVLAPNDYIITLSVPDYRKVSADPDRTSTTFAKHLEGYIREQGWQTYGDVAVRFEQSPSLHTGQFRARGAVNPDSTGSEPAPAHPDRALIAESGVPPMTDNPSYRGGQGQGRPADEYYDDRYSEDRYSRQQDDPRGEDAQGQDPRGHDTRGQDPRGHDPRQYPQEHGGYPRQGRPDQGRPDQGGYPDQGYPPPSYEPRPPSGYGPRGGYEQDYRHGGGYGPRGGDPRYGSDARYSDYDYGRPPSRHEDYGRPEPRPGYPDQDYDQGGYGRQDYGRQDYGQQDYGRYADQPGGRGYDYGQPGYGPGAPAGYGQPDYPSGGATVTLQLDDGSGRTYQLREGANVIGRGQDAQFRLPDTGVSRRHLEIRWDGQVALLSDLNSTNGTTVNNAPVQEWQLADGDVIRLGHSEIIVRVH